MTPLMQDLSEAFQTRHSQVTVEVSGGGSALGLEMVAEDQLDMGLSCWLADGPPPGLESTLIAHDGISLVVHPTNVVTSASMLQIRDLFSGRVANWQQMGGRSSPVQIISREDGSGTRDGFEIMVMQDRRVTPTALVMPSSQAVVGYVAQHPGAIGYVSMGYVDLDPGQVDGLDGTVRVLAVEGLLPTPDNVSKGAYYLSQDLSILTRSGDRQEGVQAFLDFALSASGQSVVEQRYGRIN